MDLRGDQVHLEPVRIEDAPEFLKLRLRNREFFEPKEPVQPPQHYTLAGQKADLERAVLDAEADRRYAFGIFLNSSGELIGRITLGNVARSAWQNATLGYYLDEGLNGRGYTTEAVRLVLRFAFGEAGLHRVQAAVMPRNPASRRVLEKAGFRYEGHSPRYLRIAGVWEDHDLFAITAEEYEGTAGGP